MTKSFSSKQASKQASKFSLTLPVLAFAGILANPVQTHASWNIDSLYRESAGQGRYLEYGYYGNTTPHSGPMEHDGVTFASTPTPYVSAVASINNPFGHASQERSGRLAYTFDISGAPALSYVPVSFQGLYSLSGYKLALSATTLAELKIESAIWNGDYSDQQYLSLEDSCFSGSCDGHLQLKLDTLSSIQATITEENPKGVVGEFSGTISLKTNEFGDARGAITMLAYASIGYTGTVAVEATIDPYLQIDPTWLTAHPGATLTLPQGVGNQISAVPVPTAAWLFGSGLLGFLGLKRQRQD